LNLLKRDTALYHQDIHTYADFAEAFQHFPLNKTPFPVAEYDYAVSSNPFVIESGGHTFKGIRIGEFTSPEGDDVADQLTLIIRTEDSASEESTLVESRNYPYLSAQGYFMAKEYSYEWVFASSPDGFSMLILNMKLFDLRFGETIIIYPQKGGAFEYDQLKDSPNKYAHFEEYIEAILK